MMLFFVVVVPFLPLLISQQWDLWEAWVYTIISILGFVVSRAIADRRNPDLIAERARCTNQPDTKAWDKTLQAELDGYREYAGRVRFRLLPGVW